MSVDSDEDDRLEKKVRASRSRDMDFHSETFYQSQQDPEVELTGKQRQALLKTDQAMQTTSQVCDLYLKGYSMMEISKTVKLSISMIREMIDESRRLWIEQHNFELTDLVAEQIAKIDRVESRAWESYEESRKASQTIDAVKGTNKSGVYDSKRKTKRNQFGSAEFLNVILNCIKQRSLLLGLTNKKEEDTMRHNSMLVVVNTPEEARAIQSYTDFQKMVDGTVIDGSEPKVETTEEGI